MARLTKEQWERLAKLADIAAKAQDEFNHAVVVAAGDCGGAIGGALFDMLEKHSDSCSFRFCHYMLTPQSEWTGGNNFRTREPNIVPLPREYLADVAE